MGGLVRTTGAGMGCPDWPKCFEQWVPPINDESLPEGYEQIYIEKRKSKLERLTAILTKSGMHKQANAIMNDPYILQPHPYSFKRAYTEYANRIVGVITGIFALLALISSIQFWTTDRKRTFLTIVGVFWIVFNGWLGSVVVDSNLLEGIVTIHFISAILALAAMQIAYKRPLKYIDTEINRAGRIKLLSAIVFTILSLQIISGSQVREIADSVLRSTGTPINWLISTSGLWNINFIIHRYLPIIAGVILYFIYRLIKDQQLTENQRITFRYWVAFFFLQALAGSMIIWAGNNPFLQLVHVTIGGLIFALGLNWILEIRRYKTA